MAVINRTECVFKKMCQLQGIVLFLVLSGAGIAFSNPRSCELIRKVVEAKGFSPAQILDNPATGAICGEESCCHQDLENNMYKSSQLYVDKYLKDSLTRISSLIDTRAKKFDEFFREMMNNSKREFHEMFERTYGKIYLQNSQVFSDFFDELGIYYRKGTVRLSETMDTFFGILYQRMFTVINAQYTFDDKYLECVADHMTEMKPFGDVPNNLGVQLRRSFVATRTFYKSLVRGADAANALIDLKVDEECNRELTRMQYCGVCKGADGARACSNYCSSTLESCLRYHVEFSSVWDSFVDAVDKVAERLMGPYNIEVVVEPLNIKISEAIMNFQESGTEVSQKIYTKCGKPTLLNRPKRKAEYKNAPEENPNMEIQYETIRTKKKHKKVQEKIDNTPTLKKLIGDIKLKVKDTKQFWLQLPYQYCNSQNISVAPGEYGQCWNGTSLGSYDKPKQKFNTGESAIISEQIYVLQGLTDKLRKAYQGQEVEMVDDTEEPLAGSGSGSGDGDFIEEGEEEEKDIVFTNENNNINVGVPKVFPTSQPSSTRTPEVVVRVSSANTNSMSLTRALVQFILPIVMVWFGGAIKDLL